MPTPSVTRIPTMAAAFARNPYIKAPWKASDFTILVSILAATHYHVHSLTAVGCRGRRRDVRRQARH